MNGLAYLFMITPNIVWLVLASDFLCGVAIGWFLTSIFFENRMAKLGVGKHLTPRQDFWWRLGLVLFFILAAAAITFLNPTVSYYIQEWYQPGRNLPTK